MRAPPYPGLLNMTPTTRWAVIDRANLLRERNPGLGLFPALAIAWAQLHR